MTIKEIYEAFDKIGCLSFTTINDKGEPESRIAHLRAYDDDGIYFMTMYTKDFYRQLKKEETISICGLSAATEIEHDEKGFPIFKPGYAIRMTGKVYEISIEEIKEKHNPVFDFCIKDQEIYNAMVVFCITDARGDIFDYDFEKVSRENKLQRSYFAYGSEKIKHKGLVIDIEKCISCGICQKKCSFNAISKSEEAYKIDTHRCDECGDCLINCPVSAIENR